MNAAEYKSDARPFCILAWSKTRQVDHAEPESGGTHTDLTTAYFRDILRSKDGHWAFRCSVARPTGIAIWVTSLGVPVMVIVWSCCPFVAIFLLFVKYTLIRNIVLLLPCFLHSAFAHTLCSRHSSKETCLFDAVSSFELAYNNLSCASMYHKCLTSCPDSC